MQNVKCYIFRIITTQIIWITGWLIECWHNGRDDKIVARYAFKDIDHHTTSFRTLLILPIAQNGLLILGCTGYLILRINIQCPVPHSKRLWLAERIKEIHINEKHTRLPSHSNPAFGHLLSSYLHGKEQVLFPFCLLLRQRLHNTINMIEQVIADYDQVMHRHCMLLPHRMGPLSVWHQYFMS